MNVATQPTPILRHDQTSNSDLQDTMYPARRTVATYATYPEAQRAVDYLSDQRFSVERVAMSLKACALRNR